MDLFNANINSKRINEAPGINISSHIQNQHADVHLELEV